MSQPAHGSPHPHPCRCDFRARAYNGGCATPSEWSEVLHVQSAHEIDEDAYQQLQMNNS